MVVFRPTKLQRMVRPAKWFLSTRKLRWLAWETTFARSGGRADGKIIIGKVIHRGMERNKAGELKDEGVK